MRRASPDSSGPPVILNRRTDRDSARHPRRPRPNCINETLAASVVCVAGALAETPVKALNLKYQTSPFSITRRLYRVDTAIQGLLLALRLNGSRA